MLFSAVKPEFIHASTFQRPTVSRNVYIALAEFFLTDIKNKYQLRKQMEYIQAVRQHTGISTASSRIKKKCVSKYRPISRSYFKMIEISIFFDIHLNFTINSFLAEGPGGFIEAFVNLRNRRIHIQV
jgi:hypothetical protein